MRTCCSDKVGKETAALPDAARVSSIHRMALSLGKYTILDPPSVSEKFTSSVLPPPPAITSHHARLRGRETPYRDLLLREAE